MGGGGGMSRPTGWTTEPGTGPDELEKTGAGGIVEPGGRPTAMGTGVGMIVGPTGTGTMGTMPAPMVGMSMCARIRFSLCCTSRYLRSYFDSGVLRLRRKQTTRKMMSSGISVPSTAATTVLSVRETSSETSRAFNVPFLPASPT
jgi:hypothetical protein